MIIEMDADVQCVAEFMQKNVAAAKLLSVATSVAKLAPVIWGHYGDEGVIAICLRADPLISIEETQEAASGLRLGK